MALPPLSHGSHPPYAPLYAIFMEIVQLELVHLHEALMDNVHMHFCNVIHLPALSHCLNAPLACPSISSLWPSLSRLSLVSSEIMPLEELVKSFMLLERFMHPCSIR